jgi:hypothetical protein
MMLRAELPVQRKRTLQGSEAFIVEADDKGEGKGDPRG